MLVLTGSEVRNYVEILMRPPVKLWRQVLSTQCNLLLKKH